MQYFIIHAVSLSTFFYSFLYYERVSGKKTVYSRGRVCRPRCLPSLPPLLGAGGGRRGRVVHGRRWPLPAGAALLAAAAAASAGSLGRGSSSFLGGGPATAAGLQQELRVLVLPEDVVAVFGHLQNLRKELKEKK